MRTTILLCAFITTLVAQPTTKSAEETTRALLAPVLTAGAPGVGVAVGVRGRVVFAGGVGFADLENEVPVSERTRFRIASVSKPITAACALRLVDQDKLDLDSTIQTYVPQFPEKSGRITPRLLAGHLSGIRHYEGNEFLSTVAYPSVEAALSVFAADPLVYPPGERFHYTTYGYTLLSAAIETAGQASFLVLLQREVFTPLAMSESGPDSSEPIIPNRARCYRRDASGKPANAPFVDNSNKWAGGGLLATPRDLVRFGMAHVAPGYLHASSLAQLEATGKNAAGKDTGYSLGWNAGKSRPEKRFLAHSGGAVGGTSYLLVLPDDQVVVALAANFQSAPLGRALAQTIADLWAAK